MPRQRRRFTVTDFAGLRRANNGIDTGIEMSSGTTISIFTFGRKSTIYSRRGTARYGLSGDQSLSLRSRHAGNTDFGQCFADIVQLEGFIIASIFFMLFLEKVACLLTAKRNT